MFNGALNSIVLVADLSLMGHTFNYEFSASHMLPTVGMLRHTQVFFDE
jgi:hypothetical protein